MAKIEKIEKVVTVKITVENDEFSFNDLMSFQTENFVGEWVANEDAYAIFNKNYAQHVDDRIITIDANNLEELVFQVKSQLGEDITDVYDRRISKLTFDIPK